MSAMAAPPVRFHTCPVCRREVAETASWLPTFYRHNDKVGGHCPMSGQPIPAADEAAL